MKRWITTILLALAVAAAVGVVVWRHVLPMHHVSDFYRRYHNADGIAASYIHNFPVNDTVFVDVTLLEATDSVSWTTLKKDFEVPDPSPDLQQFIDSGEDLIYVKLIPKSTASDTILNPYPNDVLAISPLNRTLTIFHIANAEEKHAVFHHNYKKTINQDN